jgi:hypothetical protein
MGSKNNSENELEDRLKSGQPDNIFTVFHIDPAFSEEIYIDEMAADTESEARTLVERCFSGHTILIIRKQVCEKKADSYPNARFINGEFHASSATESSLSKAPAE